jgi:alkyl sulfatase BDS1-like metallo-beta-lactamase superfamily hydrolase
MKGTTNHVNKIAPVQMPKDSITELFKHNRKIKGGYLYSQGVRLANQGIALEEW